MYTVKFNNGFWKVFNTFTYSDVAICALKKEADELAFNFNNKKGNKG